MITATIGRGVFTRDAAFMWNPFSRTLFGRDWCEVRYLFGADDADGKLIWTDTDTLFVPMDDLSPTDAHELTVTDFAYPFEPVPPCRPRISICGTTTPASRPSIPVSKVFRAVPGMTASTNRLPNSTAMARFTPRPHYLEGQTVLLPGAYHEQPRRAKDNHDQPV